MDSQKLFQLLVVGGALVTSSGTFAQQSHSSTGQSVPNPSAACNVNSSTSEPSPCFCNSTPEICCESDGKGKAKPKDGFYCCWGTSCGEN